MLIDRADFVRHPVAVIVVERIARPENLTPGGREIVWEWFNTVEAARAWMAQQDDFAAQDSAGRFIDDPTVLNGRLLAHLHILISDTSSMAVGRVTVFPPMKRVSRWRDETLADLSVLFESDGPRT